MLVPDVHGIGHGADEYGDQGELAERPDKSDECQHEHPDQHQRLEFQQLLRKLDSKRQVLDHVDALLHRAEQREEAPRMSAVVDEKKVALFIKRPMSAELAMRFDRS